ncbi:MAG: hypothetical protein ACJAU0_002493, partial [Flavobacteriales bacterium]
SYKSYLFSWVTDRTKALQMKNRLKVLRAENDLNQADLAI